MGSNGLSKLSESHKRLLQRGNISNITDLLLSSPREVAEKCKILTTEAKLIIDTACRSTIPRRIQRLEDNKCEGGEKFTTGDFRLDVALGGGIGTGMIWEIVGESAAGKTQLALQLSLFVQLSAGSGGLCGATCYLTTSSKLQTSRLLQICESNSLLSSSDCGLKDVHTISAPTIPALVRILSGTLPPFIEEQSKDSRRKRVKLLVVDTLAELFHYSNKTTTNTLIERSKNISEISILLHALACTYQIAIVVLNEVVDAFDYGDTGSTGESYLVYREQSRWFSRADSIPGENKKEASLGLVWANQVNARILLSRTGRRRYIHGTEYSLFKRRKLDDPPYHPSSRVDAADDQSTLVRRLTVIFSSISFPLSLDYTVTESGISVLLDGDLPGNQGSMLRSSNDPERSMSVLNAPHQDLLSQISPLDISIAEDGINTADETTGNLGDVKAEEDEWDIYWAADKISSDIYGKIDSGHS